jgi:hypothetical protein
MTADQRPLPGAGAPVSRTVFAVATLALQIGLLAIGAFSGDDNNAWRYFLITAAIAAIATIIVFRGIIPRIENLDRGALIMAIVGAIAIVVFWLGLPVVIAGGAILLALQARAVDRPSTASMAALIIGVLTIAAAIVVAFIG